MTNFEQLAAKPLERILVLTLHFSWLNEQAATRPHFLEGLSAVSGGKIIAVPGGVVVKNDKGETLGAVGITGDTSDNDEQCCIAGVKAVNYKAITG